MGHLSLKAMLPVGSHLMTVCVSVLENLWLTTKSVGIISVLSGLMYSRWFDAYLISDSPCASDEDY
jgi:hypothetical protein